MKLARASRFAVIFDHFFGDHRVEQRADLLSVIGRHSRVVASDQGCDRMYIRRISGVTEAQKSGVIAIDELVAVVVGVPIFAAADGAMS